MRYYYDLHIHSCLSPCGDNDMTPDSIAGMGELNGLDIMALTDHNTLKNCPAFFKAAYRHGIIPVAGTELTTAEDIHAVCLFATLSGAMEFENLLESKRIKIKNRPDIFGEQRITDENDNITGYDDYLLINATSFRPGAAIFPPARSTLWRRWKNTAACAFRHISTGSQTACLQCLGSSPKNRTFLLRRCTTGKRQRNMPRNTAKKL